MKLWVVSVVCAVFMVGAVLVVSPSSSLAAGGTPGSAGCVSGEFGGGAIGGVLCAGSSSAPGSPAPGSTEVPVSTGAGWTTTSDPDKWVPVLCTWCVADGEVCINGALVQVPANSGLPPGYDVPYEEVLEGPVGQATPGPPFCPATVVTTPPPPPPPPPDAVWASANLPLGKFDMNPKVTGLTQLATWFWMTNDGSGSAVKINLALDGYELVVDAYPIRYVWRFGDGSSPLATVTSGSSGGAATAAVVHTYTQAGTYEVSVSVTWQGSEDLAYDGTDLGERNLGQYVGPPEDEPYVVQQARSLLEDSQ